MCQLFNRPVEIDPGQMVGYRMQRQYLINNPVPVCWWNLHPLFCGLDEKASGWLRGISQRCDVSTVQPMVGYRMQSQCLRE